jgi:hypothetical protein
MNDSSITHHVAMTLSSMAMRSALRLPAGSRVDDVRFSF